MITEFEIEEQPDVLMASGIRWAPGLRPYRFVLRKIDETKYVTHRETMGLVVVGDTGVWHHEAYHHGNYFGGHPGADDDVEYRKAFDDFEKRCRL